ncbi:ATPase, T2SS/T4P/T4SS family, partial [Vibrio parahaemolyticus]|uniref:ATPase, T2SS/T4P/T4SS family n=1 Tax=Vibrio parahaemolyticus TaxID=670 RepID=UPI001A8E1846
LSAILGDIKKTAGVVLLTGPTGSGKTTSLYTFLSLLNDESRKIITLEDPVEYRLDGINQEQVQSDIGFGFAEGLRSIVR